MKLSPPGKARSGPVPAARTALAALLALSVLAGGCEGPRRGLIGGFRGRSQVLDEMEAAAAEAEAASGRPPDGAVDGSDARAI